MRSIHLALLDKVRPVLILTADDRRPSLRNVTVAAITGTARGTVSEVPVGARNGLEKDSVVNCDDIQTVRKSSLGRFVGVLHDDQEAALAAALSLTFNLELD